MNTCESLSQSPRGYGLDLGLNILVNGLEMVCFSLSSPFLSLQTSSESKVVEIVKIG